MADSDNSSRRGVVPVAGPGSLRRAEKVLIAVVAVLVLVFVVMVVNRVGGDPATEAEPATTAGSAVPTGGSTAAPDVVDLAAVPWSFQMPSGNIGCAMAEADVVCAIVTFDYAPPEVPGCAADTGVAFGLDAGGTAALCSTGTPSFGGAPELPYGESMTVGEFTCTSSEEGISCSNAAGQEFSLRRADFNL